VRFLHSLREVARGCVRLRTCFRIESVDKMNIPTRDQVHIFVGSNLNGAMTQLVSDVRRALPPRSANFEGVTKVVKAKRRSPAFSSTGAKYVSSNLLERRVFRPCQETREHRQSTSVPSYRRSRGTDRGIPRGLVATRGTCRRVAPSCFWAC